MPDSQRSSWRSARLTRPRIRGRDALACKWRAWLLAAALPIATLQFGSSHAADAYGMTERVYAAMQEAQGLADQEDFAGARAVLDEVARKRLSDYEHAHIWNLTAFIWYQQDDHGRAREAYEQVLGFSEIPDTLRQSTRKRLAQLSLLAEDYERTVEYCRAFLDNATEPDDEAPLILAQALHRLERYEQARVPLEQALARRRASGGEIRENWLLLLYAIEYGLKNHDGMRAALVELIERHPKPRYVLNLAAVYSEQGDTEAQLALMQALYENQHLVEEGQIVNLANLHMLHGAPFKAGELLDHEIANGRVTATQRIQRFLAQAWQLAGYPARAMKPLAAAASQADDGELHVALANLHFAAREWPQAADALRTGLDKGGLHKPGQAELVLGMALFNQKDFRAAAAAFERARGYADVAVHARQWLSYVARERDKYRSLAGN